MLGVRERAVGLFFNDAAFRIVMFCFVVFKTNSPEQVLGSGSQAQLLVDLLVEFGALRLQLRPARRRPRVRALKFQIIFK